MRGDCPRLSLEGDNRKISHCFCVVGLLCENGGGG